MKPELRATIDAAVAKTKAAEETIAALRGEIGRLGILDPFEVVDPEVCGALLELAANVIEPALDLRAIASGLMLAGAQTHGEPFKRAMEREIERLKSKDQNAARESAVAAAQRIAAEVTKR